MSLRFTCPACGCQGDLEVFLVEDEAKRFATRFAGMEPALGRAALAYLRLFKPPKQALRLARAARLIDELAELVDAGQVSRDERSGLRRAATPAMWAAGIEQMLANPPSGLPLSSHHYLRAVVFGVAEEAMAAAERKREDDRKSGRHRGTAQPGATDPAADRRAYAAQMLNLGAWSREQHDAHIKD